jgi:hypothetical protein
MKSSLESLLEHFFLGLVSKFCDNKESCKESLKASLAHDEWIH